MFSWLRCHKTVGFRTPRHQVLGILRAARRTREQAMIVSVAAYEHAGEIVFHRANQLSSPVTRIFAVIAFTEPRFDSFFTPDFVSCPAGVCSEITIPFSKMPIDCPFTIADATVITVMENCSRHATKYRFYDIQELGRARQRSELDQRFLSVLR